MVEKIVHIGGKIWMMVVLTVKKNTYTFSFPNIHKV